MDQLHDYDGSKFTSSSPTTIAAGHSQIAGGETLGLDLFCDNRLMTIHWITFIVLAAVMLAIFLIEWYKESVAGDESLELKLSIVF